MAVFTKEHLTSVVRKFNNLENLGEQWEFVKDAIEEEQINTINAWLSSLLDSDIAKARIAAFRFLLNYIDSVSKQYPTAKDRLSKIPIEGE